LRAKLLILGEFMKLLTIKTLIPVIALLSSAAMADTFYGFLNQDVSSNSCFVGIDGSKFEFSGALPNSFFSEQQRSEMAACQRSKADGLPAVIVVTTTSAEQQRPDGVRTHFPDIQVKCTQVEQSFFSNLLEQWRSEVRQSNFRHCS
jgi:hypothetical protein